LRPCEIFISGLLIAFLKVYCQVNLLFVVDEVSDDQNGKDARATGRVFVNAMKYPDWDDGSVLAKITKEYALP
jgi:hypothetical protein